MEINKMISDYLNGELSNDDRKKLDNWLAEDPSHEEQLDTLMKIWKSPAGYPNIVNINDERQKIWNRLNGENENLAIHKSRTISLVRKTLQYAAAVLILLTLYYLFINKSGRKDNPVASVKTIERDNPLGQKSRIQLPDGSTVWLNADSHLSYSGDFNDKTRILHLEGEAYFEVAENHEIPFEVFTNDLVITAVGTSFNVNAFGHKSIEKIALKNGKVKIECLHDINSECKPSFLKPGEQALFSNHTGNISISEYNGTDPFGWKDGRMVFHHATFEEVIETLSRWYNVDFKVKGRLQQEWNYSSTFENEVLENILKSLEYSEKIKYKINGSTIEITI